jgi:hypothetical protein
MLDLSSTLETLRSKGVRSARFHADGSLAAVDFEGAASPHSDTDAAPPNDGVPEPYRNALEILAGGRSRPAEAE